MLFQACVCVNGLLHKQAELQLGGRGFESPLRSAFGCELGTGSMVWAEREGQLWLASVMVG